MEGVRVHAVPEQRAASRAECEAGRDGLTLRAFLIGLALCIFLGLSLPYNRMVIQGSWLNEHFMARGALFVFLLLVLFANPILGCFRKQWEELERLVFPI